jgi:hypothetical protein
VFVPKVEPKNLLIHIAVKVERLHTDVCPIQAPLEARPEILDPVCVDVIPNVTLDMVDDLVGIGVFGDEWIGGVLIGNDVGACFHVAV